MEGGNYMDAVKQKAYTEEQLANTKKLMAVYATVPDRNKPKSIAIVSAFMDGMAAQRLLDEAQGVMAPALKEA